MNTNRKSTNFLSALVTLLTFLVFYTLADSVKGQSNTPLIEVKQGGNIITDNQFIPINYKIIEAYSNKSIQFTITNKHTSNVTIKSIKFEGSNDQYTVQGGWSLITLQVGKSKNFEIILSNRTPGIFSAIVSIEYFERPNNVKFFKFPVTGIVGDLPASLYRTDQKPVTNTNRQWNYTIYRHKMDGSDIKEYYTSNPINIDEKPGTNNIAIDTTRNLMFWTEIISNSGKEVHKVKIMCGLMDNIDIIKKSVKKIFQYTHVTKGTPTDLSMGLTINPKTQLVYFSFSVDELGQGPIQRINYDGTNNQRLANAQPSSHLALDKNGNLFAIENNKIYEYNKNSEKKHFYTQDDQRSPVTILGISIDTYKNELYYVYRAGLFKLPIKNDGNSGNRKIITNNLRTSQVSSIAYSGKKNNNRNHEKVYYTYLDFSSQNLNYHINAWNIKNKENEKIIDEGINMPSGGRLAIFPSMKAPPKPEIAVYHGKDTNGQRISSDDNFDLPGKYEVGNAYQESFTIENEGTGILKIGAIEVESVTGDVSLSISSTIQEVVGGSSKSFELEINDVNKAGQFSARITIYPQGTNQPQPFSFTIKGIAEVPPKPEIAVYHGKDTNGQQISSDDNFDLPGKYEVGNAYQESFTIENKGTGVLKIEAIEVEKTSGNVSLNIPSHNIADINAKDFKSFELEINDVNKAGQFSANITIHPQGANQPQPFSFTIKGIVEDIAKPDIKVVIGDKQASPTLKQDSLIDLGSTPLKVNKPKTFGIYNPLSNPIDVEDITSSVPTIFKVKSKPQSIESKKVGTFEIELVASKLGKHEGVINLFSNSFQNGEFKFKVKGEVTEDKALKIYNVVTPNDDNVHDFFEIVNITAYPNNKVTIFNRWGDVVYEATGYDNNNKKFVGIANKHGNETLITGNYYYAIDLGDGSKVLTGFLFLKIDF